MNVSNCRLIQRFYPYAMRGRREPLPTGKMRDLLGVTHLILATYFAPYLAHWTLQCSSPLSD